MSKPVLLAAENHVLLAYARKTGQQFVLATDRLAQAKEFGLYVVFGKDTLGGSIVIETAHDQGYDGAWHKLAQPKWTAADHGVYVGLKGPFLALRVRVTDDVVGSGAIFVYGCAQE